MCFSVPEAGKFNIKGPADLVPGRTWFANSSLPLVVFQVEREKDNPLSLPMGIQSFEGVFLMILFILFFSQREREGEREADKH